MIDANDHSYICSHCKEDVNADDDFCLHCGDIFADKVPCNEHSTKAARGVCIICSKPCCPDCGAMVNNRFLCHPHSLYEIYQGMARVFGSSDAALVEFAESILKKDGLHTFIFSRKASPISLGAPDFTLFRASGDYNGHIINEFKLMVLCQEVERAEKMLKKLKLIKC